MSVRRAKRRLERWRRWRVSLPLGADVLRGHGYHEKWHKLRRARYLRLMNDLKRERRIALTHLRSIAPHTAGGIPEDLTLSDTSPFYPEDEDNPRLGRMSPRPFGSVEVWPVTPRMAGFLRRRFKVEFEGECADSRTDCSCSCVGCAYFCGACWRKL